VPRARHRQAGCRLRLPLALAGLTVLLGLAIVVRTLAEGVGGGLGLLLGGLLVAAGGARLYLEFRS
jgi:hypothetical protein